MRIMTNPMRKNGLPEGVLQDTPYPSLDVARPNELLARCPMHDPTPLHEITAMAQDHGVSSIWIKDERARLNLGSFKALGAAYVIADLANARSSPISELSMTGTTFVTASAGNHGLSLARGAEVFGAKAVIYIADTVMDSFATRLQETGATVVREGANYEASMQAARDAATQKGWTLLSDSSWEGYCDLPHRVMEGYLTLADEVLQQIDVPPTHIFLQAGVGGMASSVAAYFRKVWGDGPVITVVEPIAAPALFESILAKAPVTTQGPASKMGRLDCKEPSFIALKGLAKDADHFMTISDEDASDAQDQLHAQGYATSASGAAGVAGFLSAKQSLGISAESRILLIISEAAET